MGRRSAGLSKDKEGAVVVEEDQVVMKVVYINTQYVETDAMSFKSVVQKLTGKDNSFQDPSAADHQLAWAGTYIWAGMKLIMGREQAERRGPGRSATDQLDWTS
ncbi:hypothetical protein Dimus_027489 [Dionaea muscipula]